MNLSIDLSCFFDGSLGYDLKSTEDYKKNLEICNLASEKLILEIKNKNNEIVNSFSWDYQNHTKIERDKIIKKKNQLVIGIGGSSAGAKAISMYLGNNVFFFDNYDPLYISKFFQNSNVKNFTIYVISKSGNTFETLAMLNLTYQHLLKISNKADIAKNMIVITEDSENLLSNFAKKKGLKIVTHNKKIGGRYSVFSETAMMLFDLDAKKISDSAESVISKLIENKQDDHCNPVINAAVILTLKSTNSINFNINLLYDYSLKNYSYWFHQLFAESLGKNEGAITPMTSICPKDHHSMMQLFVGGPKDKLFNIYPPSNDIHFDNFSSFNLGDIEKKTPGNLLKSQYLGLLKTFKNQKIPYRIFNYGNRQNHKIENLFELFSYNILETIILGYAQNINPYDQPAVEQIKTNTFTA